MRHAAGSWSSATAAPTASSPCQLQVTARSLLAVYSTATDLNTLATFFRATG